MIGTTSNGLLWWQSTIPMLLHLISIKRTNLWNSSQNPNLLSTQPWPQLQLGLIWPTHTGTPLIMRDKKAVETNPIIEDYIYPRHKCCHTRAQLGTQAQLEFLQVLTCKLGNKVIIFFDRTDRPPDHLDVTLAMKLDFDECLSMMCVVPNPILPRGPHQESMCSVPSPSIHFSVRSSCPPNVVLYIYHIWICLGF